MEKHWGVCEVHLRRYHMYPVRGVEWVVQVKTPEWVLVPAG